MKPLQQQNYTSGNKAIFFSSDALIAIMIISLTLLVIIPLTINSQNKSKINEDVLTVLSELKISETNNAYVRELIQEQKITNPNNTLIKQIGEFYITNKTLAKNLASEILQGIDTNQNIGIWFDSSLIASKNTTNIENAENIEVERQIISGIKDSESITGFSARAYLKNSQQSKYFFFGGYVGEGNLSAKINYDGNITSALAELTINENFKIKINGIDSGTYDASQTETTPSEYEIPIENFNKGENLIEFFPQDSEKKLHLAGGYIKINYETETLQEQSKQYLPGIEGIINLYDGLTIPKNLTQLKAHLIINSPYEFFLTLGNFSLDFNSTSGEETIEISNQNFSSILNYSALSQKTIPFRIGLKNGTYVSNETRNADVFSVTDLSGSMRNLCNNYDFFCCFFNDCSTQIGCETCEGTFQPVINTAKEANKEFIDAILNNSEHRSGLVGYENDAYLTDFHELSQNKDSLKNKVDDWNAGGSTCTCCGINLAVEELLTDSNENKTRSAIIMSDGEANIECSEQSTGDAKQDAIKAACDAFQEHGIKFHSVGFGSDADETTLQAIASCGEGNYYYGDIDEMIEIYKSIAQDVIESTYHEQTIESSSALKTTLSPESYIEFTYEETEQPYGLKTTIEKNYENEKVEFSIPENTQIIEAETISYSGPKWTSQIITNNLTTYNLTEYGTTLEKLGDPYKINIPIKDLQQNNTIETYLTINNQNTTLGSSSNKVIYTLIKNITAFSQISAKAEGCIWTIEFEDSTNITTKIPSSYENAETCFYTSEIKQHNSNDAIQQATYDLLTQLDTNSNNKIETKFSQQNLEIDTSEITGIPYTWSTEVQIRRWW